MRPLLTVALHQSSGAEACCGVVLPAVFPIGRMGCVWRASMHSNLGTPELTQTILLPAPVS